MDQEGLATRLKKLRKSRGLTLQEIGDLVGVSKNAVYKWESDKSGPSIRNLELLSIALDVQPVFLAYGVTEGKTPHDELVKKIGMLDESEVALLLSLISNMFGPKTDLEAVGDD